MIFVWYILLLALIIVGMKFFGKGKWNDDVLSFDQTKAFLGFCAVLIVFHHMSHRTIANWIPPFVQRPGLAPFVYVGYLCVAAFFFCSGYGLYKSAKAKPGFFKRFPLRLIPIIIPFVITYAAYIIMMKVRNIPIVFPKFTAMGGPTTIHPYSWYIPCLILMYLLFFFGFAFYKKDWFGILIVIVGTFAYKVFCVRYLYGTWWYNTVHLFPIGIFFAKYEKSILNSLKRFYFVKLIIFFLITAVTFAYGNYFYELAELFKIKLGTGEKAYLMQQVPIYFAQMISAITFCLFILMLGLKIKIGNPVLKFFGKMTLEIYLVHGVFVHLFSFGLITNDMRYKPLKYIKSVPLYILVVLIVSIPVSFVIYLLDHKISMLLLKKKKESAKLN